MPVPLSDHLRSLEERLLSPETRADPASVAALLTDTFREFGSSGQTYTKAEILSLLAGEVASHRRLTDFRCDALTPDLALVTYRSHRQTSQGELRSALRSSLWVNTADGWRLHFHQGTTEPHNTSTINLCPS